MTEEVTREAIAAAARVMNDRGISISLPWEGDLDDLERERYEALVAAIAAASQSRPTKGAAQLDRIWLLRAMCHAEKCKCADRGGMVDDYEACRLVSRHANAIVDKAAPSGMEEGWREALLSALYWMEAFRDEPLTRSEHGEIDEAIKRIERARASAPAPSPDDGWLPIESAPLGDDDFFLVCAVGDDRSPFVVRGSIMAGARKSNTPQHLSLGYLTHWRPLPPPPAQGGGK